MENIFINTILIPIVVALIPGIVGALFNKVKNVHPFKNRNAVWRGVYEKSVLQKYMHFLVGLIWVFLILIVAEVIGYSSILSKFGGEAKELLQCVRIMWGINGIIFAIVFIYYSKKQVVESIFGKEIAKSKLFHRILLNGPIVLIEVMCVSLYFSQAMKIMVFAGGMYLFFEVLGLFALDGDIKYQYEKAWIYTTDYSKYKDVAVMSIHEDKKWLIFTYGDLGVPHAVRILKSTIEKIEYYNEC